jgi:hypothetical protein
MLVGKGVKKRVLKMQEEFQALLLPLISFPVNEVY